MRRSRPLNPSFEPVEPRRLPAVVAVPSADPGDVAHVTDPSLIRQGDIYYLFSSGKGVEVRTSRDLTHWERAGDVFDGVPAWAKAKVPGATAVWAPDVSYFGGAYHLYYAVSTYGGQRSVIGLATNTTLDPSAPGYRWVDRGPVVESRPGRDDFNAIDPNVVLDDSETAWLAFGSNWSGLKLLRLDPATGMPSRPPRAGFRAARPLSIASRRGGGPIEAPFVFHKNGLYYLFVSFDRCCLGAASTYRVMVGRATSPAGPFLDRSGRPMLRGGGTPVVTGSARFAGPGSNGVLAAARGDFLVHHAYDVRNGGVATLQLRRLTWTADGWPVAGPPLFN